MATTTRRLLSASLDPDSSLAAAEPADAYVTAESDSVFIIAVLLCALICVLGLFAVTRCACLRNTTATTTHSYSAAAANKGLKKKILHSFPKFVFDASNRSSTTATLGYSVDDCCAICLAEFVDGDEIRVLPQCGHGFHAGCVDTWLARRSSCPSCRMILVGNGGRRCQKCGHLPARENVACAGPSSAIRHMPM